MRIVALVVALGGCVSPGTVECDDGTICPEGNACVTVAIWVPAREDPKNEFRCIAAPDLVECAGKPDQTECTTADDTAGECHGGGCIAVVCGNELLDSTEACDDGNQALGDGCAAACNSDEQCGNGVVDPVRLVAGVPVANETCDDRNRQPHDGCNALCVLEVPRWRQRTLGQPGARSGPRVSYDARHDQFVMFGGLEDTANLFDETWIGTFVSCPGGFCLGWELVGPDASPSPRRDHAMAYDAGRGRVVLFGGQRQGPVSKQADTWEWDGVTWSEMPSGSGQRPQARSGAAMAYDAIRKRIVLHGGARVVTDPAVVVVPTRDTWEWDGLEWIEVPIDTDTDPPALRNHAMAYDPVRGVLVLHGRDEQTAQMVTFERGTSWLEIKPPDSPPSRDDAMMAFDPDSNEILLFGGRDGNATFADTWFWNGINWDNHLVAPAPSQHASAGIATDVARNRVVVIGGVDNALPNADQHLVWNGAWASSSAPSPQHFRHAAVFDPVRGRVVVLGSDDQTWELDRSTWLRSSAPTPAARFSTMAYDSKRRRVLSFGGEEGVPPDTQDLDTMSTWNGASWSALAVTGAQPLARQQPAMAYDQRRDRVILFGGKRGFANLGDTWEWNAETGMWKELFPTEVPQKRRCHVLGYDPVQDQIVMFGGHDDNDLAETWVFDPETNEWGRRNVPGPSARCSAAMTWSHVRRRLVMVGGEEDSPSGVFRSDTWEWDGNAWTQLDPVGRPSQLASHVLAATRDAIVAMGGLDAPNEVWELRFESSVADDLCLDGQDYDGDMVAGCADEDCHHLCAPLCVPAVPEAVCAFEAPRCGDGHADPLETCRTCPADTPTCVAVCGDFYCDAPETTMSCPGDCTP